MLYESLVGTQRYAVQGIRTEAKHDVEEDDEDHRRSIDEVAGFAHPERAFRDHAPSRENMRQNS